MPPSCCSVGIIQPDDDKDGLCCFSVCKAAEQKHLVPVKSTRGAADVSECVRLKLGDLMEVIQKHDNRF